MYVSMRETLGGVINFVPKDVKGICDIPAEISPQDPRRDKTVVFPFCACNQRKAWNGGCDVEGRYSE